MNKQNPVRLKQFVPSADGVTEDIAVGGSMVATLLVLVTVLGLAAAAWFYRNRIRPLVSLAQVHPKAHLPKQPAQKSVMSGAPPILQAASPPRNPERQFALGRYL